MSGNGENVIVYEMQSDLLVLGWVLMCGGVSMCMCVVARGQPQMSVHRYTTLCVYVCVAGRWETWTHTGLELTSQ